MRIVLATPAAPRTRHGNRITALRWVRLLRQLGHRVTITQRYTGQPADLLVALHARRSYPSVRRFRALHPDRPIILALTGTDAYRDLPRNRKAAAALHIADRLVVLQPLAALRVPRAIRRKVRVILQSGQTGRTNSALTLAVRPARRGAQPLIVCVVGHLRREKDPFRAALAVRNLPAASRIRVLHAGRALNPVLARQARAEMQRNPRYRWLGELNARGVRQLMARSRLMVLSSRMEGGANVITEAVLAGLPVLASRIPGNVGLLGAAYPGYFPVASTAALRRLLLRAERSPAFVAALCSGVGRLARGFRPGRERAAWRALLRECV